jgi:hypothetical protein
VTAGVAITVVVVLVGLTRAKWLPYVGRIIPTT